MAKAVLIERPGGPEVLTWSDVPVVDPGPREVLVRVEAAGLNYIDTYHRSGYYPVAQWPSPIGVEGAGVVERCGTDVTQWSPGDAVAWVLATPGACAEYQVVPEDRLIRLPQDITCDQAAAMMLKGMTARYLLRQTYRVSAGDTILVHAAAGGVGSILVQWAHHLGATVLGTVGSREKGEMVQALGCDHVIYYREETVSSRVREITDGAGVAVVYDSVGQSTFEDSLACLHPRGLMVTFGQSSGPVEGFDPVLLSRMGSLFLTRPTLFHYIASREELEENAAELFSVVREGAVSVAVHHRYPLSRTRDAHTALEARETTGSTILVREEHP